MSSFPIFIGKRPQASLHGTSGQCSLCLWAVSSSSSSAKVSSIAGKPSEPVVASFAPFPEVPCFLTCPVKASRFYHGCLRLLSPCFNVHCGTPTGLRRLQLQIPVGGHLASNPGRQISVGTAGLQLRASDLSGNKRLGTLQAPFLGFCEPCELPHLSGRCVDLNRRHQIEPGNLGSRWPPPGLQRDCQKRCQIVFPDEMKGNYEKIIWHSGDQLEADFF